MAKKALIALAVLAVLGAAGVWVAFNYLDVLVKWTLEHYGPDVTGTKVDVGKVKISARDGHGSLRELVIGNAKGFTAPRAARFEEIRLGLDPATVSGPVVRVRELIVDGAQVTYEKGDEASNLDRIQEQIERYARRGEGSSSPGSDVATAKRRFIVDRLVIRNVKVTMTNKGLRGQGVTVNLPDLQLTDLGRREGGLTASQVAAVVASAMQQRIAQKLLTNVELLRRGGVEGAVDALKGLLK